MSDNEEFIQETIQENKKESDYIKQHLKKYGEHSDYVEEQIKEYGKDPYFNREKFLNIAYTKGMEYAVDYACNLHFERCKILLRLAESTYKKYEFSFTMDPNSKPPIYMTVAEKDSEKADCLHLTHDMDWKKMKRLIENCISQIDNKECILCFEEIINSVGCPKCNKLYCLECACNIIKKNNGYIICPFCNDEKYVTNDIEKYRQYVIEDFKQSEKAFKETREKIRKM